MRLTFFDDAGLFNAKQEPFIVIGGVIVHADEQLVPLERELAAVIEKHIPEQDRDGFVFHAMEIWNGGRYFRREQWPAEKRHEILADLVAIPEKLQMPLSFGVQNRERACAFIDPSEISDRDAELQLYSDTYARFCETIEKFMREVAGKNEITVLIGEDNDAVRALTKHAHRIFRDSKQISEIAPLLTYFPFERIREGVHFSPKEESKALQMADLVTFVVKRRLMGDPYITPYYDALASWLIVHPKPELLGE